MKTLQTEVEFQAHKLQSNSIKVNGKLVHTPFVNFVPTSKNDVELLLETIKKSNDEHYFVDRVQAVTYRVFDEERIFGGLTKKVTQNQSPSPITIKSDENALRYMDGWLRFIDPCTNFYRKRYNGYTIGFLKLKSIPSYVERYFQKLNRCEKDSLDECHSQFWETLSKPNSEGITQETLSKLIIWNAKLQKDKNADIFLPPSPFISLTYCQELAKIAIEVNKDAQELVSWDTATFFNIDASTFQDKPTIQMILNYIADTNNPTPLTVFKLNDAKKLSDLTYGEHALNNFEFFLKVLYEIKNDYPPKIIGLLNSGGFGYCLLGAKFDFFTDYISNYEAYIPPRGKRPTHRAALHPITLIPEKFNNIVSARKEDGYVPLSYHPDKKYHNTQQFNKESVDGDVWGKDAKLAGMCMWNIYTREVVEAMRDKNKIDSLFFDRVQQSAFSRLGPIIRKLNA
ncbi:MAG: hypothetical protein PHG85_01070 [Candidatus Altiarchaeota archaeon]|nr:hypothetical protein [Candidatus Altiarchaeota archaeon]